MQHIPPTFFGMLERLIFITLVVSTVLIVAVLTVAVVIWPELAPWFRVQ